MASNSFVSGGVTYFTPGTKGGQLIISPGLLVSPVFSGPNGFILPFGFLVWSGSVDINQGTTQQSLPSFPTFTLVGLPAPAVNLNPVATVAIQWSIPFASPMALPVQIQNGGQLIRIGLLASWAWTGAATPTPGNFSNLQIVSAAVAGLT